MCQMPPQTASNEAKTVNRLTCHLKRDEVSTQLVKDLIYNLQSYLYWVDAYAAEQQWNDMKQVNTFEHRLRELLPKALEWVKQEA